MKPAVDPDYLLHCYRSDTRPREEDLVWLKKRSFYDPTIMVLLRIMTRNDGIDTYVN